MRALVACTLLALAACGPKPEERYVLAMAHKLDGDVGAYYDELVALAHEAPDTRAGRRARAILQSGGLYSQAYLVGVLAAVAVPSFVKFQGRARQGEAAALLRAIYSFQQSTFAELQRYATELPAGFADELRPRTYHVFLGDAQPVVRPLGPLRPFVAEELRGQLEQAGVQPGAGTMGFIAAAVANLDEDREIDIWIIDEAGNLLHVQNDLE